MYFTFIFSECITITSSEEGLKVCECNFFQRKVVLLVIYLFNHDSSKSTIFMLNMAFDVLLSAVFAKDGKLESFVSCNLKLFALCYDMYFFIKTLLFSIMVIITFYFDICIKLILSTIISTRKEWHSADSRHSGNIRWVFPQCHNLQDI